ncbi:MAG: patatin family protein [Clostridiales bacterium]|nr:patatin family protein [Clostridiales bacterium]
MKTGVIDAGGGMRGVYAAGVLEYCLEKNIHFDCCIGVSAGSANLTTYQAGQKNRNIQFYLEYAFRKEYMGIGHLLRTGSYLNLHYMYGVLANSDGENPLDYVAFKNNPSDFFVVTQEALTGDTKYFTKADVKKDDSSVLMASCNIPGINRPFEIDGTLYFDGALGDPVPVQKAFDEGCDKVVLILTKPVDIPRSAGQDEYIAKLIRKKYPESAKNLCQRAEKYNRSVELARQYQQQGKLLIVAPSDTCGVSTLSRKKEAMAALYRKGMADGEKISGFLGLTDC